MAAKYKCFTVTLTFLIFTAPQTCTNKISNCDEYGGKEMCRNEAYKPWAKEHCYEYCGYCTNTVLVTSKPIAGNIT